MEYSDATAIAFRDMLRRERLHRDWTQARLAHEMTKRGTPTKWPAINKIENGNRSVTISEAAAIADAFGVTITRMVGGRSRPKADREFALRRLHESVADAQRAVRTSVRDITGSLAQLAEFTADDNTISRDIQKSLDQLDGAARELAQIGGKIAEARGNHTISHPVTPDR